MERLFKLVINRDAATDAFINECQLAIDDIKSSERALDTALIEIDDDVGLQRKLARAVRSLQKAVAPMLSYIIADGINSQRQDDVKESEVSDIKLYCFKKLIDFGVFALVFGAGAFAVKFF